MSKADLCAEFGVRHNKAVVPYYENREDRNRWAAEYLRTFSGESIVNIGGGGKRHLARHLGTDWTVHEIDMSGDCDTLLNLDHADRLPFDDNTFDTCCAFEVLEHLENLHFIADEMFRITRSSLLISLPNAAVATIRILRNQKTPVDPEVGGVYTKFYGLPLSVPEDRHRWWLTFEDIIRFFLHFEKTKRCRVEFLIPAPDTTLKRKLLRRILGERVFLTFFCTNVWIRIDKT